GDGHAAFAARSKPPPTRTPARFLRLTSAASRRSSFVFVGETAMNTSRMSHTLAAALLLVLSLFAAAVAAAQQYAPPGYSPPPAYAPPPQQQQYPPPQQPQPPP